jgi:hypothetical protein
MKKKFYVFLAVILGILLSIFVHSMLEMYYLKWAFQNNIRVTWVGGCALPIYLNIGLLLVGAVGGYFLGQTWWRIVYIEKRHWRMRK